MSSLPKALRRLPTPVAGMLVGGVVLGTAGGVVGLILGLRTWPPTAWFAVLEVGVPATCVGGLAGLFVGLVARWIGLRDPARH